MAQVWLVSLASMVDSIDCIFTARIGPERGRTELKASAIDGIGFVLITVIELITTFSSGGL